MKFGYYGNFSTTHQTEVYIADALERAGHTVIRLNRNTPILIDCDYVLFAKLTKMDIINKAKEQGIPTICWVFDFYREGHEGSRGPNHPHLKADIVITTDPGDKYHTIRQAINKPEKIMIERKKIYDIVFVGNPNYYKGRKKMIKRVKPKVIQNTRGLALNKILGQSKIAFGDSYPSSGIGWSNRLYEMTGRGGFYIHPITGGMSTYIPQFERGEEKEIIEYFLENEEERERLRKIQFEKCPTYNDRIIELIKLIKRYE